MLLPAHLWPGLTLLSASSVCSLPHEAVHGTSMLSASSQSYPVSGLQLHFVNSLPLLEADFGSSAQISRNLLQLMSSSAPEVLCSVLFADLEAFFLLVVFLLFLCILISSV